MGFGASRGQGPDRIRRWLRSLAALSFLLAMAGSGSAQVMEALRETAGMTGLSKWAEISVIDGMGRRQVVLQYNDYKLMYSAKVEVERADPSEAPANYPGEWRVYRGEGYLFLAEQGGKVYHVLQDGSRVPLLGFFQERFPRQQTIPTATGERTLSLTIDPETIAALERRRGMGTVAGGGRADRAGGELVDTVLVYCLAPEVDEASDIQSLRQLTDLRASTGTHDMFTLVATPGSGTPGNVEPVLNRDWVSRNKKWLYRVTLQNSPDPVTRRFFSLVVDGTRQLRPPVFRYTLGRYMVYGPGGDPGQGSAFLAISLSSLDRDEVAAVSGVGQRLMDLGGRAVDWFRGSSGQETPLGQ